MLEHKVEETKKKVQMSLCIRFGRSHVEHLHLPAQFLITLKINSKDLTECHIKDYKATR